MNFGIITSFVIGGLMLLSILAFNMNMSASTQETTLTTITQQKMNAIVEVLSYDLNRIGYKVEKPFPNGNGNGNGDDEIEFRTADGTIIKWYTKKADKVTNSSNPNDYYLYRKVGSDISKFPVTHFELRYFDKVNYFKKDGDKGKKTKIISPPTPTSPPQTDIFIEVKMIIESEEPTRSNYSTGSERYHRAVWQRTFVPNNINKPY